MSQQEIDPEENGAVAIVEEPEEEQDDIYPPLEQQIENTHKILKSGLERIGKTSCGKNHAFVELRCDKKRLTDLFTIFHNYPHLRRINLANNWISDVSTLATIKYLTHLDLSNNRISTLDAFTIPETLTFLEDLNLSGNKISALSNIVPKNLLKLNLSNNQVTTCETFDGHPTLNILQLKKNKLVNAKGIHNMPNLEELYIAENPITSFFEVANLPKLKKIHARKTEIKQFGPSLKPVPPPEEQAAEEGEEGSAPVAVEPVPEIEYLPLPDLPLLAYLNIRETKFDDLKQMKILQGWKSLAQINALATEMTESSEYAIKEELIMLMPKLKRINKEPVEPEEVNDALNKLKERIEEQERIRQEEEARRIEEEEKRKEEELERLRLEEEERKAKLAEEEAAAAAAAAEAEAALQASKPPTEKSGPAAGEDDEEEDEDQEE